MWNAKLLFRCELFAGRTNKSFFICLRNKKCRLKVFTHFVWRKVNDAAILSIRMPLYKSHKFARARFSTLIKDGKLLKKINGNIRSEQVCASACVWVLCVSVCDFSRAENFVDADLSRFRIKRWTHTMTMATTAANVVCVSSHCRGGARATIIIFGRMAETFTATNKIPSTLLCTMTMAICVVVAGRRHFYCPFLFCLRFIFRKIYLSRQWRTHDIFQNIYFYFFVVVLILPLFVVSFVRRLIHGWKNFRRSYDALCAFDLKSGFEKIPKFFFSSFFHVKAKVGSERRGRGEAAELKLENALKIVDSVEYEIPWILKCEWNSRYMRLSFSARTYWCYRHIIDSRHWQSHSHIRIEDDRKSIFLSFVWRHFLVELDFSAVVFGSEFLQWEFIWHNCT